MNQPLSVPKLRRPPEGTQAVIRAIHLLKAVSHSHDPVSLDDLSRLLGLSKSTAHRIVSALISEGMIQQDPVSKLLTSGPDVLALTARAFRQHDLRSLVHPVLERLVHLYGETATLEISVRSEMLILDEVVSQNLVGAKAEVGTSWPMYATSSGKMTLSTYPDDELRAYLRQPRVRFTANTCTGKRQLLLELNAARARGFAIVEGELQDAFNAVSAVVRNVDGRAVASLSIGGPSDRLNRTTLKKLGAVLKKQALDLEPAVALLPG